MSLFSDNIQVHVNNDQIQHFKTTANRWNKHCTSHTPSMQTFLSLLEQGVPSLTLLDMAKKKSKSSAMQYSLQMSSAAQRTYRNTSILQETCCLKWRGLTFSGSSSWATEGEIARWRSAASAVMLSLLLWKDRVELENLESTELRHLRGTLEPVVTRISGEKPDTKSAEFNAND